MRLIIFSDNSPYRVNALLDGAFLLGRNHRPDVVAYCADPTVYHAYTMLAHRHRVSTHFPRPEVGYFRQTVLELLAQPRKGHTTDTTVMMLLDTMLISPKFDGSAADKLLRDDAQTLGVTFTTSPPDSAQDEYLPGMMWKMYRWLYGPGDAFSFGTLYRTSDVLWALQGCEWENIPTMLQAANASPTLRRRERMASLGEPLIKDYPETDSDALSKYVSGYVIDINQLAATGRLYWKPYEKLEESAWQATTKSSL